MRKSTLIRIYDETLGSLSAIADETGVPVTLLLCMAAKTLIENKTPDQIKQEAKSALPANVKFRKRPGIRGVAA